MAERLWVAMEDASELLFGEEDLTKQENMCLSNAEVANILEKSRVEQEEQSEEPTRVFKQTLEYVNRFSGTPDPASKAQTLKALRDALETFHRDREGREPERLHYFEIASLANLVPEDVDEVQALLPSIHQRFREDEIEDLLQILETNIDS